MNSKIIENYVRFILKKLGMGVETKVEIPICFLCNTGILDFDSILVPQKIQNEAKN